MKVTVCAPSEFGQTAARTVADLLISLQRDPTKTVNMVFATGRTMIGFLDNLAHLASIDWSRVRAFHLDEYKGLSPDSPYSFAYFLDKNIFSKVPIPAENINYINGASPNIPAYLSKLKSTGGADILMLGVGMDGHLAFNEPPRYSSFDGRMGEVSLTQETIDSNVVDYPEIVQHPYAYSMGMADIFEAKNIFFLANGPAKAEILKKAITGPVTSQIPASILQTHPHTVAIFDYAAASLLSVNEEVLVH